MASFEGTVRSPLDISQRTLSYPSDSGFTTPKAFITHAASLRQSFLHCAIFRDCSHPVGVWASVSVPVWRANLSDQLPVDSLGGPLPHQLADRPWAPPRSDKPCRSRGLHLPQGANSPWSYPVLVRLSTGYPGLQGRLPTCYSPVRRCTSQGCPRLSPTTCMSQARRQRSF